MAVTSLRLWTSDLRVRANQELADLGPPPANARELRLWTEERRGAVILLAFLADRDAVLLRRAALEVAGEWGSTR